jgi:hypothetical protein
MRIGLACKVRELQKTGTQQTSFGWFYCPSSGYSLLPNNIKSLVKLRRRWQGRTYWFWLGGCNHEMRPTHHWNVNPDRLLVSWCVAIKLSTKHGNSCHLLGILQEYTYSLLWDIVFLLSVRALSVLTTD